MVLSYVNRSKEEMPLERAKTYERLEHPLREAQANFTMFEVLSVSSSLSRTSCLSCPFRQHYGVRVPGTGGKPGVLVGRDEAIDPTDVRHTETNLVRLSLHRCGSYRKTWRTAIN